MRKGFTLIEVMVVAVIVAILAAVAVPAYQSYIDNSANRTAENIAATVATEVAAYFAENGVAPGNLTDGITSSLDVSTNPQTGYTIALAGNDITVVANRTGETQTITWSR